MVVQVALGIGFATAAFPLNGTIDEFRIWNYARSSSQLAENYSKSVLPNESGLVAYYDFNQGSSGNTTLVDLSSNGNNGTLTNFEFNGNTSDWVAGAPSIIPIPTMSQWTLMILGLVMISLAVVTIRKSVLAVS